MNGYQEPFVAILYTQKGEREKRDNGGKEDRKKEEKWQEQQE